jgi:hypothetical protein
MTFMQGCSHRRLLYPPMVSPSRTYTITIRAIASKFSRLEPSAGSRDPSRSRSVWC